MTIHTRVIHIHTTTNYNWHIISHCYHYYYILDYFFFPLYPPRHIPLLIYNFYYLLVYSAALRNRRSLVPLYRFSFASCKILCRERIEFAFIVVALPPSVSSPDPPSLSRWKCSGSKCEANGCWHRLCFLSPSSLASASSYRFLC